MSAVTAIEWTDRSWNPTRGCSRDSHGCKNCFAEREAWRHGSKPGQPYFGLVEMTKKGPTWTGEVRTIESALWEPLKVRKPQRWFVDSMSDLFHAEVDDSFIDHVMAVAYLAPRQTFQILTKRARRMCDYMNTPARAAAVLDLARNSEMAYWVHGNREQPPPRAWPPPNVMLGVSAEDQEHANLRISLLMVTLAARRFVSLEPLLGAINLRAIAARAPTYAPGVRPVNPTDSYDVLRGERVTTLGIAYQSERLDQVIVGGESGLGARPSHPAWFRSVRDQCVAEGVPFFFKQWGAWCDLGPMSAKRCAVDHSGRVAIDGEYPPGASSADQWQTMYRVGKGAAGRLLDGRTWDEEAQP